MDKQVFISYKAEEYNYADKVRKRLESEGIACWIAPDCIEGGKSYAQQIPNAIRNSAMFILMLSSASMKSRWVSRELDRAINSGKRIMPFLIESIPLTEEFDFYLSNVQAYPAYRNFNAELEHMVADILKDFERGNAAQPGAVVHKEDLSHINSITEIPDEFLGPLTAATMVVFDGVFCNNEKTVSFGHYALNRKGKGNPIEWIVLERKDRKMLLISKYGIECKRFNLDSRDVDWEKCSLRKWLNEDFLYSAFNNAERKFIEKTNVIAESNPVYNVQAGNDTEDRIFILNLQEAEKYFAENSERQCKATEYAKAQGAYVNPGNGNSWWWLRSPGDYANRAAAVVTDGSIDASGYRVTYDDSVIRPAMWVSIHPNLS